MPGPGRRPRPPPGTALRNAFVFPNRSGRRPAGRGAAGAPGPGDSSRPGVRAETASLLGAGRARRVHVQSCRPRRGAGAGPGLGYAHSPVTPGAEAAGARGEAGHEGDRATAEVRSSEGCSSQGVRREGVTLGVPRTLSPRRENARGPDSESSRRSTAVLASGFLDVSKQSRPVNVAGRMEFSETQGETFRRPVPAPW